VGIAPEDFIKPALTEPLQEEFQFIDLRDAEFLPQDLWSVDALCYRSQNLINQFKTDHDPEVKWKRQIQ
jgi:hypothetical protein